MMKKIFLLIPLICFGLLSSAQQNGIAFEQSLTLEQLLVKAKTEHKKIFIDCYASWCGPCKRMDAEVYTKPEVGEVYNNQFICVRIQMDKTGSDNDAVKSSYPLAAMISDQYQVKAFPTFLFLDENGKPLHKAIGFKEPKDFIQTAEEATDPDQQYFTLLGAFQAGQLKYASMPVLSEEARSLDEKELASKVAAAYIHGYLDKLNEKEFLTKANVNFIGTYPELLTSASRLFKLCFEGPVVVDSTLHDKDYAEQLINQVAYKEAIDPKLKAAWDNGPKPDWTAIANTITTKFGASYVEDNMIVAKIKWYKHQKDARNYTHYLTIKVSKDLERNGIHSNIEAVLDFNNAAWEIFQYDLDTADLKQAVAWEDAVLKFKGQDYVDGFDTKANLLYKAGEKQQAIELEERAAAIAPKDKDIATCLAKMRAGETTWPKSMP